MENQNNGNNQELEQNVAPFGNLMDTKTTQLDDLLKEKLESAFHMQTSQIMLHDVAKIASEYDPIDLAYAVLRLPSAARVVVYENLPDIQAKIIFMIHTSSSTRSAIFKQIDDHEIKTLLESMPPDEAVWMLDDMSDRRMKRVLDLLQPKKAASIKELQRHERHSAGRLMTNEFFAFHMNATIGEVAETIRDNPGIDLTRRVFVLGDEGELTGYVPERNLIVNPDYLPMRQVMRPVLHTIHPDASRNEVVDIVERYQIPALPVVNENNQMVGVITYEDVVEVMEDIADETIASMAGTAEDVSEHEPIFKRFVWRAPWLVVSLCAGLVTATAMAHFRDRPWFLFVPLFVPLITGMSGNVGIQVSTVLVRGMSTGELSIGSRSEAIQKELAIGSLIGVVFGITCGLVVYALSQLTVPHIYFEPIALGTTVAAGVFGACLTSTTLGAFSPFFFAHFRIDPAVAAGPIVTAFNDVLSTLMFFLVARLVYEVFAFY